MLYEGEDRKALYRLFGSLGWDIVRAEVEQTVSRLQADLCSAQDYPRMLRLQGEIHALQRVLGLRERLLEEGEFEEPQHSLAEETSNA